MRNKKLFILISVLLVLSFIFISYGKKIKIVQEEISEIEDVKEEENLQSTKLDESTEDALGETVDIEDKDESVSNTIENKAEPQGKVETSTSNPVEDKKPTVTITIIGPEDTDSILDTTEVEIKDEDTVFDLLKQVLKDNNIQMEYKGKKSNIYVQGIHNIYELDKGPESGWIFRVNGEVGQISSGAYKLKDGDNIEWLYTIDLGREFGEDAKEGGE